MTNSEKVCNILGEKFFGKDFAFENLKNQTTNNEELCDGLFQYSNSYVILQIKERSLNKGNKSDEDWLKTTVHEQAMKQIINTIIAIRKGNIKVYDKYHKSEDIKAEYYLYPIIIFDNPSIVDYVKVQEININDEIFKVNIFSLTDYKIMMEVIVLPSDIINYLERRFEILNKTNSKIPNTLICENKESIFLATGGDEEALASFFCNYIYSGDVVKKQKALELLAIINLFRNKQIKKHADYKNILLALQKIDSLHATSFMERWKVTWECAINNVFNISNGMHLCSQNSKDKNISIMFVALGNPKFETIEKYKELCLLKQQQHKTDIVVLLAFNKINEKECFINWVYYEDKYVKNEDLIKLAEKIGLIKK